MSEDRRHEDPCTVVSLPFEPASVGRARSMLVEELTPALPRDVVDDAELVLSELLTNGLVHGEPHEDNEIEAGWCLLDGLVQICVRDAGRGSSVAPLRPDTGSEGGRGLAIVEELCAYWTVDVADGVRVRAEIAVPTGPR